MLQRRRGSRDREEERASAAPSARASPQASSNRGVSSLASRATAAATTRPTTAPRSAMSWASRVAWPLFLFRDAGAGGGGASSEEDDEDRQCEGGAVGRLRRQQRPHCRTSRCSRVHSGIDAHVPFDAGGGRAQVEHDFSEQFEQCGGTTRSHSAPVWGRWQEGVVTRREARVVGYQRWRSGGGRPRLTRAGVDGSTSRTLSRSAHARRQNRVADEAPSRAVSVSAARETTEDRGVMSSFTSSATTIQPPEVSDWPQSS